MSEPAEKTVKGMFQKIIDSKLLVIMIVIIACSFTGLILYLLFGRGKKEEAKKE